MTHSRELIEKVKAEIRYKAKYAGIPFDEEDIEHHEIEDHTLVALMKIKTPETEIIDDRVVQVGEKQPNIWVTYPSPSMTMGMSDWQLKVDIPVPDIHILRPSLVFLILPNGTITGDQALYPLFRDSERRNAQYHLFRDSERRNAEDHLAHLLGDIYNRPGECGPIEATRS